MAAYFIFKKMLLTVGISFPKGVLLFLSLSFLSLKKMLRKKEIKSGY